VLLEVERKQAIRTTQHRNSIMVSATAVFSLFSRI